MTLSLCSRMTRSRKRRPSQYLWLVLTSAGRGISRSGSWCLPDAFSPANPRPPPRGPRPGFAVPLSVYFAARPATIGYLCHPARR